MNISITKINIQSEADIHPAIAQVWFIAKHLDFERSSQTRICAAISGVLHQVLHAEGSGQLEIQVDDQVSHPELCLSISYQGVESTNFEKTGLTGEHLFMDGLEIKFDEEGACILITKHLPYHAPLITNRLVKKLQRVVPTFVPADDAKSAGLSQKLEDYLRISQSLEAIGQEISALCASLGQKIELQEGMEASDGVVLPETEVQPQPETALDPKEAYDPLTGLPNRILFHERFKLGISRLSGSEAKGLLAIMLIEVSNFDNLLDEFGRECADEVLLVTTDRISRRLRMYDTVARLGEDKFVVILENIPGEYIKKVAEEYLMLIQQPFLFGEETINPITTIGISIYPIIALNLDTLLKQAEQAIQVAKSKHSLLHIFESVSYS